MPLPVCGTFPHNSSGSPEWPSDVSIQADAGIVMDSDTGTVLYGKTWTSPITLPVSPRYGQP